MELNLTSVLLLWAGGLSLVTWLLYGLDKLKARQKAWRIPEKVLLGTAILGGAPGALLGMVLFRHKTNHWYFWIVCCLACAAWGSLLLRLITVIN